MECPACHTQNIDGARFCAKCGALLPVKTDETDPLINTVVGGRYRITGILGEGGMGRVYVGEQQMGTSVRKTAVKTLLAQYAKEPETVARFMREVGTVSELEHPNTIKVYDFGQTPSGELYIAMELLSGKSLEEAIEKDGAMAPERVDRIVGQVCGSLSEAHGKGVVHRDLKPANIFLTTRAGEEDYVKVLDFGIAKKSESAPGAKEQKLTQQGKILGTPPYMSPEQFTGKELDARSDIYSLAVMTYEMLTGRLPFDADTPWGWATQHMTAQPFPFEAQPMAANVPHKMKAAVMRALEKDKSRRPQTVREYFDELTLGAQRLSMVGHSAPGVSASGDARGSQPSQGPGTSMLGAPSGGARGGQTQVGEPIFVGGAPPGAPQGQTLLEQPAYIAPAMGAGPTGAGVPTGGGQAYAPPPMQARPKSNPLPLILLAGLVVAGSVVGAVVLLGKKRDPATGEGVTLGTATAETAETTALAQEPPPPVGDTTTPTSADAGVTKPPTTPGTGAATSAAKPTNPAAEAACAKATGLALGGNIGLAVNEYRKCEGPKRAGAFSAIDAAGKRAAAKGCRGKPDAQLAASIGASGGLNLLKDKKCP